jgi:hypothetical protein
MLPVILLHAIGSNTKQCITSKKLQQSIQILQMDATRACKQEATRLLTLQSKATAFKGTAD